ncbi:unnamed protein product, partial [Ixodes hexagonus]
ILKKLRDLFPTLFRWYDAKSRVNAMKRLNDTIVTLGIPSKFYSPAVMESVYSYLPVFNGPFVEDLLRAHRERADLELFIYAKGETLRKTDRDASIFSTFHQFGNAFYVPYLHTVYVPSAMLSSPFVLLESLAASYGLTGGTLAHEILHGFSPLWVEKDRTGVKLEWMSDKTWDDYHKRLECIIDQYDDPNAPTGSNYSVMTLDENYADIAGFELLLEAVKSDPCIKPDAPSAIEGLTNKQMFYVGRCFKYCATHDLAYGYYGGGYATFSQRCNKVLSNFRDFWETFQCQTPSHKLCPQL